VYIRIRALGIRLIITVSFCLPSLKPIYQFSQIRSLLWIFNNEFMFQKFFSCRTLRQKMKDAWLFQGSLWLQGVVKIIGITKLKCIKVCLVTRGQLKCCRKIPTSIFEVAPSNHIKCSTVVPSLLKPNGQRVAYLPANQQTKSS
jgi:hypothetical protein